MCIILLYYKTYDHNFGIGIQPDCTVSDIMQMSRQIPTFQRNMLPPTWQVAA